MPKNRGTRYRQLLPISLIWHPPLSSVIIYEDHERTSRRNTYVYSRGRGPRHVPFGKDSRASARCLRIIKKPPPATVETASFLTDHACWTRTRVSDSCSRPLNFVPAHPPTHLLFFVQKETGRRWPQRQYLQEGITRLQTTAPLPHVSRTREANERNIEMTKDYTEI